MKTDFPEVKISDIELGRTRNACSAFPALRPGGSTFLYGSQRLCKQSFRSSALDFVDTDFDVNGIIIFVVKTNKLSEDYVLDAIVCFSTKFTVGAFPFGLAVSARSANTGHCRQPPECLLQQ
ncbi:MAG TPA: hypothetical protein VFA48_00700, partial [Gammaproteobacteria bacterium]|nr:hypothetical protein [Gammaproteobacteria bacterium]